MPILEQSFVHFIHLLICCAIISSAQPILSRHQEVSSRSNITILFTTGSDIKISDIYHNTVTTEVTTKSYAISSDVSENILYWIDGSLRHCQFHRMEFKKRSTRETIIDQGVGWPISVAFDWITGNLYYVEMHKSPYVPHIGACDMDRRFCVILTHDKLINPYALALHPNQGIMFFTDRTAGSPHIMRCGMDGSNCRIIISKDAVAIPTAIVVDQTNSRIYFSDERHKRIMSSNFDGLERRTITSTGLSLGMGVLGDTFYWSDYTAYGAIQFNSIYSYNLSNGTIEKTSYPQVIYSMLILDVRIQPKHRSNQCLHTKCSHLCTLSTDNATRCFCPMGMYLSPQNNNSCIQCDDSHSCLNSECRFNCNKTLLPYTPHTTTCKSGWKLATDGSRSCEDIDECSSISANNCDHYCFNTIGSYHCECRPNYHLHSDGALCWQNESPSPLLIFLKSSKIFVTTWDVDEPSDIEVHALDKNITGLEVDKWQYDVYWANAYEGVIGRTHMNNISGDSETASAEILLTDLPQPHLMTYDYLSDNIYFVSSSLNEILVCQLKAPKLCAGLYELGNVNVTSMKLATESGILFWIEDESSPGVSRIQKGFTDGSHTVVCITDKKIRGIAVDSVSKNLYYMDYAGFIFEVDFNCSKERSIANLYLKSDALVAEMEVYENHIIISNGESRIECRINSTRKCISTSWKEDSLVTEFHMLISDNTYPPINVCEKSKCLPQELCLNSHSTKEGYKCLISNNLSKIAQPHSKSGTLSIVTTLIVITLLILVACFVVYKMGYFGRLRLRQPFMPTNRELRSTDPDDLNMEYRQLHSL